MAQLTEAQAWRQLANWYEHIHTPFALGDAIDALRSKRAISGPVARRMELAVDHHHGASNIATHGAHTNDSRVLACLWMALEAADEARGAGRGGAGRVSMSVFVFGSNLAGRHGKGAALCARNEHGAEYGVGEGRTGNAYAIPTKDEKLQPRTRGEIATSVARFLDYARKHLDTTFNVTPVGCGLAGFKPYMIAPFFINHTSNVKLPPEFMDELERSGHPPFERLPPPQPHARRGGTYD